MSEVQVTVDQVVEAFVANRDALKKMDEEHEERRSKLVATQNLLTEWMMQFLKTSNASSVKTAHGTCYASTRYTASLADPEAFMRFVIDNGKFELLDRRANATAVRDFVAEAGGLPPGCNLSALQTIGVRRANGKSTD